MEPVQIRKSKWVHRGIVVITGLMILGFFLGPYDKTRIMYDNSPGFTLFLGLIFSISFFHSIRELFIKKPEIILTEEGIEIRDKGWNHWTDVNSINMLVEKDDENGDKKYLIIHLKDSNKLKCLISDLDRSPGEIINLVSNFKNNVSTEET
jgi:hypothetical protein